MAEIREPRVLTLQELDAVFRISPMREPPRSSSLAAILPLKAGALEKVHSGSILSHSKRPEPCEMACQSAVISIE